jgi:hypothetical protein
MHVLYMYACMYVRMYVRACMYLRVYVCTLYMYVIYVRVSAPPASVRVG